MSLPSVQLGCGGFGGHGSAPGGALDTTLRLSVVVEWRHHSNQAGTPRRATNPQSGGHRPKKRLRRHGTMADGPRRHWCAYQRRCGNAGSLVSTHRRAPPAGDRPEERRAPTQRLVGTNPRTGRPYLLTLSATTSSSLALGKCVSEVVRGSFILVWGYVGIGRRVPIVLSCCSLRFSLLSLFSSDVVPATILPSSILLDSDRPEQFPKMLFSQYAGIVHARMSALSLPTVSVSPGA